VFLWIFLVGLSLEVKDGLNLLIDNIKLNITIDSINLSYNNIDKKAMKLIKELVGYNPNIRNLSIGGNNLSKSVEYLNQILSTNQFLRELDLSSTGLNDRCMVDLAESFKKNKGLRKLLLNDNEIKLEGAKAISSWLESNQYLIVIELMANQIDFDGAVLLYNVLGYNKIIEKIAISSNSLNQNEKVFFQSNPDYKKYKDRIIF